jgi:Phytanoyl-CoA dioxygenase (PhyH)
MTNLGFPLQSNGFTLRTDSERLGWLRPSDPNEALTTLRERFFEDGHLWLKGLLPRDEVLAFRRHVLAQFADTGLIVHDPQNPIASLEAGVYSPSSERADASSKRLMEIVRSAAYESFCLHPKLWGFLDVFLEGPSYLHKRKILRYTKPGAKSATGAHYDLVYLRAGTDRFVTAWIPIGDVSARMGGLTYLEGSDRLGRKMEADFTARNRDLSEAERISAYNKNMTDSGWISSDLPDMAERFNSRWLIADYEAGDVMLHSPFMVHAATQNLDPENRLRLSTDIRFQNLRDEIDARWNNHWTLEDML